MYILCIYMTSKKEIKLQKWGNSYGIRLPKEMLKALRLRDGSSFFIYCSKQGLRLEPIKKKKDIDIDKLINSITPENLHEIVDWGDPVGKEVW